MHTITLYSYRVRHERTGKWYKARNQMTPETALSTYGEGKYELIAGSGKVIEFGGDPMRRSAAHLAGPRWKQ